MAKKLVEKQVILTVAVGIKCREDYDPQNITIKSLVLDDGVKVTSFSTDVVDDITN